MGKGTYKKERQKREQWKNEIMKKEKKKVRKDIGIKKGERKIGRKQTFRT